MTQTELALLGFISWFIFLVIAIEIYRTIVVVKTGKAVNSFSLSGADISPLMERLSRAHANCYESFPFLGGLLLFSISTASQEITNSLALYLLAARITQSLLHIASSSNIIVQCRFLCFCAQIGIVCYWLSQYFL